MIIAIVQWRNTIFAIKRHNTCFFVADPIINYLIISIIGIRPNDILKRQKVITILSLVMY